MVVARPQGVEDDVQALLPNDPLVPPKGDVCLVNDLPPELLSRIFEVGAADDDDSEDEDDGSSFSSSHRADGSDAQDSDAESEEGEDDEETDEDEDEDYETEATESSDSPPPRPPFQIVVSHVCRHWRHVALSTPSLWTTIEVTPEARPPYRFVSMLLERSKGLPVDIHVDCEPDEHECGTMQADDCGPTAAELSTLYHLLSPHVHRWRTIEISVSDHDQILAFLDLFSNSSTPSAPQLKTLQLYHHGDGDTDALGNLEGDFLRPILFGGSAPSLTSVALWGVYVDWGQSWIASASKLVDLELAFHAQDGQPTWAQLATILRGATSLEKLSLRQSGPLGDPPEWFVEPTSASPDDLNAPVLLPKVTDFVLAFYTQARAIGLLKKLAFPAVKHLVLDFDEGDFTDFVHVLAGPATSVSSPLAHEQPSSLLSRLQSLKLAGMPCREGCVEELYEKLQNLTSLNLSLSHLHPHFVDVLSSSSASGGRSNVFLPSLTTLYVSGTCGNALREVVENRRLAGAPLQSLYVEESCDLDDEDEEWLKQNVETFRLFEGSDDEDVVDFDDLPDEGDADGWSDTD